MTTLVLLAAALGLVVLPGAAVCVAAGARWRVAVAAGPALTLAIVGSGTAVTSATDSRWGPLAAAVATLAAILLATAVGAASRLAARRRAHVAEPGDAEPRDGEPGVVGSRDDDEARDRRRYPNAADLVVALLSLVPAVQVTVATRGLTAIPQQWDAIFHGAATRFIAETGRAGPLDLGPVSQPANPTFYYPGGYHALAALLTGLPGGPPPGALDALSAVTGTVFVLGAAALTGRLCRSRIAAVVAAVVAASLWIFPYSVLGNGPVLPYAIGLAAIPGLMLLAEHLAARSPRSVPHALLLGSGVAGTWAVHPSVSLAVALPLVAAAVAGFVAAPGLRPRLAVVGAFALAAAPAAAYALWTTTLISSGTTQALAGFAWPRAVGVPTAVLGVLDRGPTTPASVGAAALVLLGVAAAVLRPAWRRPLAAPIVALLGFGTLYVLARAVDGDWVRLITSYWWDDSHRFAALLSIPMAVLAGAGARAVIPRGSRGRAGARAGTAVAGVLVLLAASGQGVIARDLARDGYGDGPAVTAEEREVFDALAARHDGGVVLGDPFDGSAWVYALHGIPVVLPAPLAGNPEGQMGADRMLLYTSMNRYGFEPVVTHVVHDLDVRWVVVGTGSVGGPGRPGGFVGLRFNPNLQLEAETPGARLYRVLPVPLDHPPLAPPPGIPPVVPEVQPPNTDSPLVDPAPAEAGASLDGADGP